MFKNTKFVIKVIGNLLMIAALIFIIHRIWIMKIDWSYLLRPKILLYIFAFILVYIVYIYFLAFAWKLILQIWTVKKIPYLSTLGVYCKANLEKYIPGNIMQFVGRNIYGEKLGLSQLQLALSSVIEIILTLFTGAILCLPMISTTLLKWLINYHINIYLWIIIGTLTLLGIMICIMIFRKNVIISSILYLFLQKQFWILCFILIFLYSLGMIVNAFILVVLINDVISISFRQIPLLISAYIGSWLVGYVFPGSPGGLGVRESILLFILSKTFPSQSILIAIVIQRLISILGDILAWIFYIILDKMEHKGLISLYTDNN